MYDTIYNRTGSNCLLLTNIAKYKKKLTGYVVQISCDSVKQRASSGSAGPCLWLMDPDSDLDPAIFVIDLQDANKKLFFYNVFLFFTFWKYICIIFQR